MGQLCVGRRCRRWAQPGSRARAAPRYPPVAQVFNLCASRSTGFQPVCLRGSPLLGAAHARRRTLAAAFQACARSMLTSVRHPWLCLSATPAPGHGQPLAAIPVAQVVNLCVFPVRVGPAASSLACDSGTGSSRIGGTRRSRCDLCPARVRRSDRVQNSQVPPAPSMPPAGCGSGCGWPHGAQEIGPSRPRTKAARRSAVRSASASEIVSTAECM